MSADRDDRNDHDDPLLEIDGLAAAYGETRVLEDVSLSVSRGEVASLIGRNGAGKTTTLRCVLGSLQPIGGQITYAGTDVTNLSSTETARLGIALVPEDRRIFPGLTVRENLALAGYGGSDEASRWTIEEVLSVFESLADREGSRGAQLSGGEQQMLAIARALVAGADLLLLDEPTEGLAPYVVRRVEELITDLNDADVTILLVEQNVRVALDVADRHHVLDRGRVVYEGSTTDLDADESVLDRHLGVGI
ncbi:ABC transporter ATP-binding protein [Halobacteriales archaeon QS_8_65_32]|nr:MAG: ABC transporter ATP-binding protein [Halobacteriales archaeon QS_8_65_32]